MGKAGCDKRRGTAKRGKSAIAERRAGAFPAGMFTFRDARPIAFAALAPLTAFAADVAGVACQGRIIPESRLVNVAAYSETGVAVVSKLRVSEGDDVKAGDVIAELASLPVAAARVLEAKADAESAALAVGVARQSATLAIAEAGLARVNAVAAYEEAKRLHARMQATPAQVSELEAALAAKTSEVARLVDNRPAFVERADKGVAAAKANVDVLSGDAKTVAEAELAKAVAARELAIRDYDVRLAGEKDSFAVMKARLAHVRDLNAIPQVSDAEFAAAENRRNAAGARLEVETARGEAEIARAGLVARAAEARVATLSAIAGASVVKAPLSGRILKVNARSGEAAGPSGIVEMADLSKILVLAEVSAPDLPRVKAGAKAEVRVPGLEKPLSGTVTRVGSLIGSNSLVEEDPAAFRDLRVASVEVTLDDPKAVSGLIRAQVTVRIAP